MGYAARILADSLSPDGLRLTSMEVTLPRLVLSEFNTHRQFSRNSASSRAIPVDKRIAMVDADPFVPAAFGRNKAGMQAAEDLGDLETQAARETWMKALRGAVRSARALAQLGVHKQLANRLIEPFCWHTVIVSATEWDNYWGLRCSPMAQPEIRTASELMRSAYDASQPSPVNYGDWHLPLVDPSEAFSLQASGMTVADLVKVSVGRCARVSYLTHDGKRDPQADIDLYDRLYSSGHMSPMEHVARPMTPGELERFCRYDVTFSNGQVVRGTQVPAVPCDDVLSVVKTHFCGNYSGWVQHRKELVGEDNFLARAL